MVTQCMKDMNACMHEEFWAELQNHAGRIDVGGRNSVRVQLDAAVEAGWSYEQIATWVKAQLTGAKHRVHNPAGFVLMQLRNLPARPEQPKTSQVPRRPGDRSHWPAWCGECDEENRMRDASDGRLYQCPACNPGGMAKAG